MKVLCVEDWTRTRSALAELFTLLIDRVVNYSLSPPQRTTPASSYAPSSRTTAHASSTSITTMLVRSAAALLSLLPRRLSTITMTESIPDKFVKYPEVLPYASKADMILPGDLLVKEHTFEVPLSPDGKGRQKIEVFVREMVKASQAGNADKLPCLLYLQGGPGFPSPRATTPPSGWCAAGLKAGYRVLLLDQRGTGRSTPITAQSLRALDGAQAQADYLSNFRADAIVRDCEVVRKKLANGQKLTLLGQSFGGFCILSYLSYRPESIERTLFTVGLAPVGQSADDVYRATFKRMEERNRRYYARYPQDIELIRAIVRSLHEEPRELPRGGTLTARRFLQLGIELGRSTGFEALHDLLELARCPAPDGSLPDHFLLAVEGAQEAFETNPIYWLLHESIYCDGPAYGASRWAAERVQRELGDTWDYTTRLDAGGPPVMLTGEMVFSWMAEDYAWLRPLKDCADLLATKDDWPRLYEPDVLSSDRCPPSAALVSYEDTFVERAFSEATANLMGPAGEDPACKLWITNEFQHNGLRVEPGRIFDTLLGMAKGEHAIPS